MKLSTLGVWIGGALIVGLAVWTAASAYIMWGIEEARYDVVGNRDGYEIRRYAPMIIAETAMEGTDKDASARAFRTLASYIFGENEAAQKIKMTAPVIMDDEIQSQDITMTAPVLVERTASKSRMAFVMPSRFTRETPPRPKDDRITIREVPERRIAALGFSWYAPLSRRREKEQELLSMLRRDGVEPVGAPIYAGYNPPFSVPFLMRHEILVEIAPRSGTFDGAAKIDQG